ncbi:class I SAM-dependent methyltransferase [Thalassovita sp.]|uniref:class I SAM-dependent methyltransferase n=1 Tax=Thalassovita sp. TaxID=1979401 RepID=UPI0029DE59F5|nr:methyltransferase [Thalassovita sp.]
MSDSRIAQALGAGLTLPAEGRIAVFGPRAGMDLSGLPKDRLVLITGFKPDVQAFEAAGYDCAVAAEGDFAAAIVVLPRAKALARAMIAGATRGPLVIVDGQKTDGVESILKDLRKRETVQGVISKAHGKLFWFAPAGDYADWVGRPARVDGFVTRPGVFSADGVDAASRLLADALPPLSGKVADLGAGWGYLSARMLADHPGIRQLHLVEADHAALVCARENVTDERAQFHWADATTWRPGSKLDVVVMNPPFHTGRAAEPDLGRAFIATAAASLAPSGQLWLVANRHLPYEAALSAAFAVVEEAAGDNRFKILHAARPTRLGR